MNEPTQAKKPSEQSIAARWWRSMQRTKADGSPNSEANPGALARLRRCATPIEALTETETIRLCRLLGCSYPDHLQVESIAVLAVLLAHVRDDARPLTLGAMLGLPREHDKQRKEGKKAPLSEDDKQRKDDEKAPVMSDLRLRQLMAARDAKELLRSFREALSLLGGQAPVADLARTILGWFHPTSGERTRTRFLFDYHGALDAAPPPNGEDAPEAA
jgi:CRISPR type I-E-associated protein CasB/Cse2